MPDPNDASTPWLLRVGLPVALFALTTAVAPRHVAGVGVDDLYRGDIEAQGPLALEMARWAEREAGAEVGLTGSALFDAEWRLVSCQMTVLGLGQVIAAHPETRDQHLPAMEACLDWMVTPEAMAFGAASWGERGKATEALTAHAYLGYLNVALSMHRTHAPTSRFAALNDQLTGALAARLRDEPPWALATYPGEMYPADVSTVVASIALYDDATGADHAATLTPWVRRLLLAARDPDTGLLAQSLHPPTGRVVDGPRASGTAFVAYFLAFADVEASRGLWEALKAHCYGTTLGFGGIDEYPPGASGGFGDVDSGPVVFGVGTSATGFAIAAARIHGDGEAYRALARTANLFGAPHQREGRRRFLMGGSIGNALMLAMLTARGRRSP
ncbi:MAG: hypothetical protein CMH57_07495 [Myxococcales bacterium]|nr:hypothetical protein [Myxococcales bacterium]